MKTSFNLNLTDPSAELVPHPNPINTDEPFLEILSSVGAQIILGEVPSDILAIPLEPSAKTLFGPRGPV